MRVFICIKYKINRIVYSLKNHLIKNDRSYKLEEKITSKISIHQRYKDQIRIIKKVLSQDDILKQACLQIKQCMVGAKISVL